MRPIIGCCVALCFFTFSGLVHALTLDTFEGEQVCIAHPFEQQTNAISIGGTLGGVRKIKVIGDSGYSFLKIEANVVGGLYSHSQDASVTGSSQLMWDGSTALTLNPIGLSGINLLQDAGSAFVLDVLLFDLPGGQPCTLVFRIYDASDLSGNRWSETSFVLSTSITSPMTLTVPFSSFNAFGPEGAADLQNIGALTLTIEGTAPAIDLVLDSVRTDGTCNLVPGIGQQVVDQCGVCGGDNSTCLDCTGIPNGPSTLDRCNVCNGDGISCLDCTEYDQSPLLTQLDGGAKKQERIIKRMYRAIEQSTSNRAILRQIKKLRPIVHQLQIRNWTLSWVLPRIVLTCSNTFCTSSSNAPTLDEYRVHSEELRQIANDAATLLIQLNPARTPRAQELLALAESQHARNMALVETVPLAQSTC